MAGLQRTRYVGPIVDEQTMTAARHSIEQLREARELDADDLAAQLHLVASLREAFEALITQRVADASAGGLSWAEIGDLLGTTKQAAHARFSGPRVIEEGPRFGPLLLHPKGNKFWIFREGLDEPTVKIRIKDQEKRVERGGEAGKEGGGNPG
jgi:hypothetical protein